jgi:hypothetical protein
MAAWQKYKVHPLVTDRAPDEKSYLRWLQREVHPILREMRSVVNWIVDQLGKVGIDATDVPGNLEDKLKGSTTVTVTKSGAVGDRTITLTTAGVYDGYDHSCCVPGLSNAGAILGAYVASRAISFPASFTGSECKVEGTAPAANVTIAIKKRTAADVVTTVGTLTIAAGATVGVFTVAAQVDLAIGDSLVYWNQTPADATMTGLTITTKGARA